MNYKASLFKMLILPRGHDHHSHRLLWPNRGQNKDLAHEVLCHQTEFLLLMKWPKPLKIFILLLKALLLYYAYILTTATKLNNCALNAGKSTQEKQRDNSNLSARLIY